MAIDLILACLPQYSGMAPKIVIPNPRLLRVRDLLFARAEAKADSQPRSGNEEAGNDDFFLLLCGSQSLVPLSRSALLITETELKLMAALAIMGLSSQWNNGKKTPAAMGIPNRL